MATTLLATTLLWTPTTALAADDDERWIDRYVETTSQQAHAELLAAESIPFQDLAGMRGQSVRVLLRNGQQRLGVIQRASASRLNLRVPMPSGYADYELARADVQRVLKEATP